MQAVHNEVFWEKEDVPLRGGTIFVYSSQLWITTVEGGAVRLEDGVVSKPGDMVAEAPRQWPNAKLPPGTVITIKVGS